jgi:hypothetical protein
MTARQAQRNRMATAAAARTAPEAPAAGQTAIRTKPVRITVDLDPADYLALNHWLEVTGETLSPDFPRPVQKMQAIKAMIRATVTDDVVNAVVVDLLRKEQAES